MTKALVPAVLVVVALLAGCAPSVPVAEPTDAASQTPTPDPTPTETAPPTSGIPADMTANIADAMNSGNTAALDGYLAASVDVVRAASELYPPVTDHAYIIDQLTALTGDGITWDFDLSAAVIESYRTGADAGYAKYFPENTVVGRSSDDEVVSFTVDDSLITTVFIGVESSLTP